MKTKNLLVLTMTLSMVNAYAQQQEQVLNSEPIDVDGYLHEKQVTDSDLENLKSIHQKYKNDNQLYKEKTKVINKVTNEAEKIGDNAEENIMSAIEMKKAEKSAQAKIQKAEAKLKCLMEDIQSPECDAIRKNKDIEQDQVVHQDLQVQQAAPVATSVAGAPSALTGAAFEEIKFLAYAGGTQYNGKVEQLESEMAAGLRLESNISTRFSMGVGLNYGQMKTNDFASNFGGIQMGFTPGREIQFKSMGIDLYGKFFITKGERFRPYFGAALGYQRANLKYTNNDTYSNPYQPTGLYGNENYATSFATGTLLAGTEVMITKGFGINIEAAVSSALGSAMSSQSSKSVTNGPDQMRLRQLGEEIINANAMSIFAGAVFIF